MVDWAKEVVKTDMLSVSEDESELLGELEIAREGERWGVRATVRLDDLDGGGFSPFSSGGKFKFRRDTRVASVS